MALNTFIKDLSEEVEMPIKFLYDTKLGQLEYRTKIENNTDRL